MSRYSPSTARLSMKKKVIARVDQTAIFRKVTLEFQNLIFLQNTRSSEHLHPELSTRGPEMANLPPQAGKVDPEVYL